MGRKRVRPEALTYYCNVCGALKEDKKSMDEKFMDLTPVTVAFRSSTHWCHECLIDRLERINEWKAAFDSKVGVTKELTALAYGGLVNNFCISCGGPLEPPRKCYCKKCKEHSQYQAKDMGEGDQFDMEKPFREYRYDHRNGKKVEWILNISSKDKEFHAIDDGWYCNVCGRWMKTFPNEYLKRGATKFWCSVCINNPAKRKLLKIKNLSKQQEKWQYCIRCRGALTIGDRQLCTKCRRRKRPWYMSNLKGGY